ncbi:MAG TPA: TonB-dependent receptor [Thermoanaerobaculia bacterium]|nr:TonB-dependent receptor [Thermoanaerobaculia bacterium]
MPRGRRPFLLSKNLLPLLVPVLLLAAPRVSAQTAAATLEVVATDAAGAPVPGASVEAKSSGTGLTRTGVTGVTGIAKFAALPTGTYDVTVKLQGFETVAQKGVVLRVGQTGRVNVTLAQRKAAEVSVVASAPLVDVYKIDSSTNVSPEQIRDLPTPDRDFQNLAFIAPTVERERGAFRFVTGGPVIGGGGNASQSTILVDGVDFTDPALGLAKTKFSQDAISEFRVISNRFDAEVGGSAGGALSVLTKSGTNTLSGTAFGFYRGPNLRARGAFEQDSTVDYERNQFGATVGGPIVKDRTFFFGSIEQVNATTPTLFRPKGAFTSQAADYKVPIHQTLGYLGLDQTLSENNHLIAKLDYERFRQDNFRVGGVAAIDYGQELNRDNLTFAVGDTWNLGNGSVNEARAQYGSRKYEEPTNTARMAEWYSSGNTLQTGGNILGNLLGDGTQFEFRDTLYLHFTGAGSHDVKVGAGVQRVIDRSRITTYEYGLMLYLTDSKALPLAYAYGIGSADVKANTTRLAAYVQDDWRPVSNLTVSLGVRYDYDSGGNNPNIYQPNLGLDGRPIDTNNFQPRLGISWDITGKGQYVARGGVGMFTGRYLLVPAFTEMQQNGYTGRVTYTNINGALLGFPAFALDPNNPQNTGIKSKPAVTVIDKTLDAPESTQATLGFTAKLGQTGLYADVEGIYMKGRKEITVTDRNWSGNASHTRPNTAFDQINTYTNDGRSEYMAAVFSLNGNIKGGHVVTASLTLASKHNISDDFSPEFPTGYPNDPANLEAEYGRARSWERYRVVISGIARLPWGINVAPVFEYGAGQPWTQRLGYDYNGDGKNSDRPAGVSRFAEDGPAYRNVNIRISKMFNVSGIGVELIAECFNLFNTVNYDVTSIDGARYLSGPTIANPNAPANPNPNYGAASATLSPREGQIGLRVSF